VSGQSTMLTGSFKVAKVGKRTGPRRAATSTTSSTPATPVGRIPRVARLMALAIKLDGLIKSGEVTSQRELAAIAHVTPARVTQILNLLGLAPDIQELLLNLPAVTSGRDPITEREIRPVAALIRWSCQRAALGQISGFSAANWHVSG
jgi:hypothetical protein